jgi:dTDP-4-amino-4,6-dideoxygalactose transaminase
MTTPTPPRLYLSPPHMSGRELDHVHEAFAANQIAPAGPVLQRFEQAFAEYVGIPHTVALASGTAAIHLALRTLEAEAGREVWTSTLTFIGGVGPIHHEQLRPVFFDSDPATWCLDPRLLAAEMAEAADEDRLPAAVIPTDLFGQSADLDAILAVCNPYGVPVIADSAEAVGARYHGHHAGRGAWATAYSFNGNKIITTSGGGLLASEDRSLIERVRYLSTQARQPVAHYEHIDVGYNYRMSSIVAAIGLGQLEVIEDRVAARRRIFEWYRQALDGLPGIAFMPEAAYGTGTRWLTVITVDPASFGADREAIRLALEAVNIESRPVWKPMHLQPVFAGARRIGGAVAEGIFADGLCLPSGSAMSEADVARVGAIIRSLARA